MMLWLTLKAEWLRVSRWSVPVRKIAFLLKSTRWSRCPPRNKVLRWPQQLLPSAIAPGERQR